MELRAAARTKDDTPGITELIYRRALSGLASYGAWLAGDATGDVAAGVVAVVALPPHAASKSARSTSAVALADAIAAFAIVTTGPFPPS